MDCLPLLNARRHHCDSGDRPAYVWSLTETAPLRAYCFEKREHFFISSTLFHLRLDLAKEIAADPEKCEGNKGEHREINTESEVAAVYEQYAERINAVRQRIKFDDRA